MRKLFTLLLFAVSIPVFCVSITFNVKMSGQALPKDTVFIVGEVTTDWSFQPMFQIGDSLYSWTTELNPGDTLGYYFITVNSWDSAGNENWNYYRDYREWFDTICSQTYPGLLKWDTDRQIIVPDHDSTIICYFAKCPNSAPVSGLTDEQLSGLFLFPNPTQGNVSLRLPSLNEPVNIEVIDYSGKILNVGENQVSSSEVILQTASLPKGLYLIRIHNDEFTQVRKLIIK